MNLVIGATGTIGAQVALQLLQQNKSVVCAKQSSSDINKTKKLFSYYTPQFNELFNSIKWVDVDVCDIYSLIDAFEGIYTVYNCSGFVSFNRKFEKKLFKINVEGVANIVNACLEKNIKALCHVSSIAAIHNPDITQNIHEGIYWKSSPDAGNYAISKYNGEREVWRGIEEGLNAVIVNPSIVLAPGFWKQSSGKLFDTCYNGSPFYTSGASATVDVVDVANCMIKLIDKKVFNQRFIISEGNHSFKEILTVIQTNYGKKPPQFMAGKITLTIGKYLDFIRCLFSNEEQLITKETIVSGLQITTFDNSKIKNTLDFTFKPLQESSRFICNCYLNDLKN